MTASPTTAGTPPRTRDVPAPDPGYAGDGAALRRTERRVVIAHDFLESYGGAERLLHEIAEAYPDAPVYAIAARASVARRLGISDRIHTVLPARERLLRHYRATAPLLPAWLDATRLPAADVLITSSYVFAHRFRTANDAPQLCYCHTPPRFVWNMVESYRSKWAPGALSGAAFRLIMRAMRESDRRASERVTRYVTTSPYVGDQIDRYYGRTATVLGAPVDTDLFHPGGEVGDYYLFCGRIVEPHKCAGAAIEAFRGLDERLVIAGDGPDRARLEATAPPNVEFVGELEDEALVRMMQGCKALVFPSPDPFGMLPIEAMACGRPVIANRDSGARHTVLGGVTGEFFDGHSREAIAGAIRSFDPGAYDTRAIRAHALGWDRAAFRLRLRAEVEDVLATAGHPQLTAVDRRIWEELEGAGRPTRAGTGSATDRRPDPAPLPPAAD